MYNKTKLTITYKQYFRLRNICVFSRGSNSATRTIILEGMECLFTGWDDDILVVFVIALGRIIPMDYRLR